MLSMSTIAQIPKRQKNYQTVTFGPWAHGVNTVKPAFEIQPTELSYCLNFMPLKDGQWKTRPAVVRYSNSATTGNSAVKCLAICPISSNNYELLIDDNNVLYYYDSSLNPVEIKSTLEGEGSIQPFAGTAMIFDTSYIKFCDLTNITAATKANPCVISYSGQDLRNGQSITINDIEGMTELNGNSYIIAGLDSDAKTFQLTSTDSSAYTAYADGGVCSMLSIAYDKGTGISGYQFDNHTGDDDTTIALGDGTNKRVAWKFTSQSWDSGYTIPIVTVTAKLKREGNGFISTDNVDIWCRLRKVSGDACIAAKVLVEAPLASNVSITADEYSVTFNSDDILNEMDPGTAYYLSLEYDNGDASNYIHVCCTTVLGSGMGYYYTTEWGWADDTVRNPIMSLSPGRPPKGSWGIVNDSHLIVYDPDNPGKPVFSGPGDFQDWSTPNLAGYVGAVDDTANSYKVGAMVDLFGDAFFFGTKEQPYLAKLVGSSPEDWSIERMFQQVYSTHKTCLSVINDVWFGSRNGVDGLSGVQEYGDLRTFFASDPIYDRIEANWDENTTIAGYYPADGQYFLYMAGDHRIQVAHTKIPSSMGANGTAYSRYPWTEYELYRDIFTDKSLYGFIISDSYENVFNAASTSYLSVAALDSTHFVVAYQDGCSNQGIARVGVISGTTISLYGAEKVFNAASTYSLSVAALDSTHFVVAYRDEGGSEYGIARVGVVSGTSITYGAEKVFNAASTYSLSVAALDSTHFVVAYRDNDNSDRGAARVGVVSEKTISSYGAENVFNAASTYYISVAALDSTHFVVAYRDEGGSDYGIARVGVVSGVTISSFGAENVFNADITFSLSVAALDSTHFVVAYRDGGCSFWGIARVGEISGTTISSYGAGNMFNAASTSYISVAALDSTHFVVAYRDDDNSDYGVARVGVISGKTISSYGAKKVFNKGVVHSLSVAALDSTHFVTAYRDGDNSDYGTLVVGTTTSTAISFRYFRNEYEYRLFKWDKQDLDEDYTEIDPELDLTVTDDKIVFDTVDYATMCTVYKDFGVDYFDVSFKHEFQLKVTSCDDDTAIGVWSVANNLDSINGLILNDYSCLFLLVGKTDDEYILQFSEVDSGTAYSANAIISKDVDYYITIVRDENVGNFGALYCYIYADLGRDTLLGTLSLSLHTSKKDFQYLYALHAVEGATGTSITGEVSKLSIESDPNFGEQPDFVLKDEDKIEKGATGSLINHKWCYGDNDNLGYDTFYFGDGSGDPNTTGITLHSVLAPTMFANYNDLFFIGGTDGYIYRIDPSECKDQGLHNIIFTLQSYRLSVPFTHLRLVQQYLSVASKIGSNPVSTNINRNIDNWMVTFHDVILDGQPLYINNVSYKCTVLST